MLVPHTDIQVQKDTPDTSESNICIAAWYQ